jgi:NADP-dependent 3-hydroxy acid dehydrogenase YdfG
MVDLTGQVALITGASSGVGRAIAMGLAAHGVHLGLLGRDLESLRKIAADAPEGCRVEPYRADLTREADIDQVAFNFLRDFTVVDLLVHSAGLIVPGKIEGTTVEQMDQQYAVNVRAPHLLTQRLLPSLRARQGQLVFINSTAGLEARATIGSYAATKHALRALADSLREEVNEAGIRVLSVYLGRTATPMQAVVHRTEGRPYRPEQLMQPDDVAAAVVSCLRLPRTAEVTDLRMRPHYKSH